MAEAAGKTASIRKDMVKPTWILRVALIICAIASGSPDALSQEGSPDLQTTITYIKEKIAEDARLGICPSLYNVFSAEGLKYLRNNRFLRTEIALDARGSVSYFATKRCGRGGGHTCSFSIRFNVRNIEEITNRGTGIDFRCQRYSRCVVIEDDGRPRNRDKGKICAYNEEGLLRAFRHYQSLVGGFVPKKEAF